MRTLYHPNPNLTSDEAERYLWLSGDVLTTGAMDQAQEDAHDFYSGVANHIDEARGGFIAEDWCDDHIADLRVLAQGLCCEKREELERIAQALEEARDEAVQSAEYSLDELKKATAIVDGDAA